MVSDHDRVATGVSVDRGSVVVHIGMLFEVFRAEEGLEPEAEHVEGGHSDSDEADEPRNLAEGVR